MIEQQPQPTSFTPPSVPQTVVTKAPAGTAPLSMEPKQPRKIFGIDMRSVLTVLGLTLFFILAMIGVLIALRQRTAPDEVSAPNAPVSEPQAAGANNVCTQGFTVVDGTPPTYSCDSECTTDAQCQGIDPAFSCYTQGSGEDFTRRCRLTSNPTSATCLAPTFACNSACSTDAQCQTANANFVCDQGSEGEGDEFCRLDSNPTSLTCEADVVTTYQCNTACTTTAQCQTANPNFVCDPGTAATNDQFCRLASNPTSITCAAATTYACNSICTTDAQCSAVDPDFSCETVGSEQRCRLTAEPTAASCQATGGPTYSCDSICTTNAQCESVNANYTCATVGSEQRCRLETNTTSATCAAAPLTVGCQQTCVSNADCTNPDHICYNTGSGNVCRLETNPQNTSCQPPAEADQASCQEACTTNSDCADANHICQSTSGGNVCRLSTNPDSRTCSAPVSNDTNPTVGCQATCTSNASCSDPDHICYNTGSGNVCRLADNPTSTTCSAMAKGAAPAAPAAPTVGQPELPAELPQSGAGDIIKWLGPGIGALLVGALVLFLL